MLAFVPVWILIMAMIWEKIKLDKKSAKEYECWRDARERQNRKEK